MDRRFVDTAGRGLRRMFQLLKDGLFVALLPDQEPSGGGGGFAPFFGIEALTTVNRGVEQCIEVDSEQYLWAYKRFRNRPPGEKSFYKR